MRSSLRRLLRLITDWLGITLPATPTSGKSRSPLAGMGDLEGGVPHAPDSPPHYTKRASLLTPAELQFYRYILRRSIEPRHMIFAMVRLSDLVDLTTEPVGATYSRGEAWAMHLDFVICDRNTLEPLLAIELDDSSHQRRDHEIRDAIKNRVCADAHLPLLRVKVVDYFDFPALSAQIRTWLSAVPDPSPSDDSDEWSDQAWPDGGWRE